MVSPSAFNKKESLKSRRPVKSFKILRYVRSGFRVIKQPIYSFFQEMKKGKHQYNLCQLILCVFIFTLKIAW